MKEIKGVRAVDSRRTTSGWTECLPQAVEALKLTTFFKKERIMNHRDSSDSSSTENFTPNSLYIFCTVKNVPELEVVDSIEIKEGAVTNSGKYDLGRLLWAANGSSKSKVLEIYSEHFLYGFYFLAENVLWLCDLTHEQVGEKPFKELQEIIEKIQAKGGLTSLVVATTEEKKEIPRLTVSLGADPEFELLNEDGEPLNLESNLIQEYNIGDTSPSCEIGRDGGGSQIEFRPKPAKDANDLVGNLKVLFNRAAKSDMKLGIVGNTFPLGGHLHFGIGFSYNPPADLRWLLDYFIGKKTLGLSGNARGGYKQLATDTSSRAIETKNYGFEYRVPPACIFAHPRITYLVSKIGQMVVEKYINEESFSCSEQHTIKDYQRIGLSKKEAEDFLEFCKTFTPKSSSENIVACWKDPSVMPEFRLGLSFSKDNWSGSLKSVLCDKISKMVVCHKVKLYFYGLNTSRGENSIAGITLEGFDTIDNLPNVERSTSYGIPHRLRISSNKVEVLDFATKLCEAIQTQINLKK